MENAESLSVSLSRDEWLVIQEALNRFHDEVEHAGAGGLRRSTRTRNEEHRQGLLRMLPRIEATIALQSGLDPL